MVYFEYIFVLQKIILFSERKMNDSIGNDIVNELRKTNNDNNNEDINFNEEKNIFCPFNTINLQESDAQENNYFLSQQNEPLNLIQKDTVKNSLKYNNEKKNKITPDYFPLNKIIEKYNNILKEFSLDFSEKDANLKAADDEMKLLKKKKIRIDDNYYYLDENDNQEFINPEKKYCKGRKSCNDDTQRKHNKCSSDNIMIKEKRILYKYLLIFINEIIKVSGKNNKKIILKKVDSKIVIDLKVNQNKENLSKTIKEILCQDKYNKNRIVIETLLEREKNNEVIQYVFNLKFREFINILTMKNDIKCYGNISNEAYEVIKNKLPKIKDLLNDVSEKDNDNNKEYLSLFLFYLINFEKWFYIKNSREKNKN